MPGAHHQRQKDRNTRPADSRMLFERAIAGNFVYQTPDTSISIERPQLIMNRASAFLKQCGQEFR
jgi:hypothetical protein